MLLEIEKYKNSQKPEYLKIKNKIQDISQAKEIWTKEMKILDEKFFQTIKDTGSLTQQNKNIILSDLTKQRTIMFSEFYKSKEFKDYLQKNKDILSNLNTDLKNIQTPEIIKLQKEVLEL
jgi:hypothetical protein